MNKEDTLIFIEYVTIEKKTEKTKQTKENYLFMLV